MTMGADMMHEVPSMLIDASTLLLLHQFKFLLNYKLRIVWHAFPANWINMYKVLCVGDISIS